jgi:hypothetical protein
VWIVEALLPVGPRSASARGRTGEVEIVIEEGQHEVFADIELDPPEGIRFSGRVTVDGRAPLLTYLLLAADSGSGAFPALNALGEFDTEEVRSGVYQLTVAAFDTTLSRLGPVDLRTDLHLELALERLVARGTVVDAGTGLPVEGAEVFVLGEGAVPPGATEQTSVVSGPDGAFGLTALVERRARLLVRAPGYQPAELLLPPGSWEGARISLNVAPR